MDKYVTYIDGRWVDNSGLAVMEYWDGIEWIDTNTLPISKKGGEKSMQERLAVKCNTKAEWYAVQDKAFTKDMKWSSVGKYYNEQDYQSSITIGLVSDDISVLTCSTGNYYKDHKYTIISAEEYLKEGEDELPTLITDKQLEDQQDDICDFCRNYYDESISWHCEGIKCSDILDHYLEDKNLTLTKEEHTMSIVINETVAKVFTDIPVAKLVTRWVGDEYPENNHRALLDLEQHKAKVLRYCEKKQKEEDSMNK